MIMIIIIITDKRQRDIRSTPTIIKRQVSFSVYITQLQNTGDHSRIRLRHRKCRLIVNAS